MRGLLEKDISILKTRKNSLVMFVVIMAVMGYSVGGAFIIGYGSLLFGIMAISSLSYDEFDNGMPFLLSLPISRKEYVTEKFVFSGGMMTVGWFCSVIISIIFAVLNHETAYMVGEIPEMLATLVIFLAVIMVLLAVELKYGVEKSRTVLMVLGGAVFAAGVIMSKFLPEELPGFLQEIESAPDLVILSVFIVIAVAVITAAYLASCKIMEHKQY